MVRAQLIRAAAVAILICLILLSGVSFVQFYAFPKSPSLTKANYPYITHTASGKPGDPINVLIIGNKSAIESAFLRVGWKIPDPITIRSSAKIAFDSLANLPYPTAPVSNLYLYSRKQDLAFERPTNTVQNREHIRLWDTHTTLDHEEVWLGSATFDHGIEISGTTHTPTHHVAPNVDQERENVYQALTPYMQYSAIIPFTQPTFIRFNGGADWYYTDGDIAILSSVKIDNESAMKLRSPALAMKDWIFAVASFILRPFS